MKDGTNINFFDKKISTGLFQNTILKIFLSLILSLNIYILEAHIIYNIG